MPEFLFVLFAALSTALVLNGLVVAATLISRCVSNARDFRDAQAEFDRELAELLDRA
ncbi:MAG: hypothetical protein LLG14_08205 [Nocardiaceae bacterium]|nr:hypothetical protein [Nocardiaceae bacterium]